MLKITQVYNPLDADLVIEHVQADAGLNGEIYAQFSQSFSNFVVPAGQTVNSGKFDHVFLPKGAEESLLIVPFQILDSWSAVTCRIGQGGYQIPFLKLEQKSVPTTYNLDLFGDLAAFKKAGQSLSASSIAATASKTASGSATDSTSGVVTNSSPRTDSPVPSPTPAPPVNSDLIKPPAPSVAETHPSGDQVPSSDSVGGP